MIYVDEIRNYGNKGDWCHMWTDGDVDELHQFAKSLGLKPAWIHNSRGISGSFSHFDLRPSKRELALKNGAVFMPLKDWIKRTLPAPTPPTESGVSE